MLMRSLLIAAVAACGTTSPLPPGAACTQTSECETDLMCLDVAQITGTTCTVVGKSCSIVCQGDNICATRLGLGFQCFMGCGADKFCGDTAH